MPTHSIDVNAVLTKTEEGFTIKDNTTYPTGSDNHRIEEFKYCLIVVDDPRGYRYLLSSHNFIADVYNSIDSPATVASLPLTIPKSDSGVGRYRVAIYAVPEFDEDGDVEDNYGEDDCFAVNDDGAITFYRVLTDVVPTTDTNLANTSKYEELSSIVNVTEKYRASYSQFFVMEEWIACFRKILEKAYCKIDKEPANQSKLCKDPDVINIAKLIPVKRSVLAIEAGDVSLSTSKEKQITNLANSLCCCSFFPEENAASSDAGDSDIESISSVSGSSGEGIGYWFIDTDFVVS